MPIERLGFVGHGYVGSATAEVFAEVAEVRFHDPAFPESTALAELMAWADAVFVCVPTPSAPDGSADIAAVMDVMEELAGFRGPVILKSTVPPGTCDAIGQRWPALSLVFSPEFLRERHHLADAASPVRNVLGWTEALSEHARVAIRDLYVRRFADVPLIEMGATQAELLKYTSNAFLGVKVSFANEMSELATRIGVEWEPVREALVLDPRIGDSHLKVPGPDGRLGFGGSCLPKDMAALVSLAGELGAELRVVRAAAESNADRREPGP